VPSAQVRHEPTGDSTTNRDDVVATGPPVGPDIGILAGPMPDDFAARAQAIAANLRGGRGPGWHRLDRAPHRANKHQ
jgi:hypothetical protein